jgi:hypothetical protein
VVAVVGEQLTLPVGDGFGVEPFDASHDQPALHVVGFAPGGERGEGDLGDLSVGDESLFVLVPDRVGVSDRGPCRLVDARDRRGDSGIHPGGDRELGPTTAGGGDHVVAVIGAVGAHGDQPAPATCLGGDQGVGDKPGCAPGGVGASPTQPGRGEVPVADVGVETIASNAFKPLTPVYPGPERPIGFCRTQPPRHATVVKRDGVGFHSDCIPPPPTYAQVSVPTSPTSTATRVRIYRRIPGGRRTRPTR